MYEDEEGGFRDSINTITKEGNRNWIYPKKPIGKFYNWRSIAAWIYIIVFLVLPWIKVNGQPLFLIDIFNRKFILFSKVFWPQDFFIFVLGMITFILFIVLFTVVYGRLFCGWVCPQTVFMEMIFRKVEYWIEGTPEAQRRLTNSPWNAEKIKRRGGKIVVFYLISFIIANYFLAYLIGMDNVVKYVQEGIGKHLSTFIPLIAFSLIFFFVYLWFREQVCIIVCPYGRLQSVMLDSNSIVVAYDYVRGEERQRLRKNIERTGGDCVDCGDCVKVCPTGIDIRNGTQLECVNCTACIDACDAMMERVHFPTGLIRYASEKSIKDKEPLRFTARIKAYTAILIILIGVLVALLVTRKDVSATIMRAKGQLYVENGNTVSNIYNIKLANKTVNDIPVELKIIGDLKGTIRLVGDKSIVVKKEGIGDAVFFVDIDKANLKKRKNEIEIGVFENGKLIYTRSTNFLAPNY